MNKVFQSHFKSSQVDLLYSSVLLDPVRSVRVLPPHYSSSTTNSELSLLVPIRSELTAHSSRYIAVARTTQKSQLYCCIRKTIEKTNHVIVTSPVHWGADCCLATRYKHSFTEIELLLLRTVPGLQSCCLATRSSNPLHYLCEYNS
jgi:hypothetical protein